MISESVWERKFWKFLSYSDIEECMRRNALTEPSMSFFSKTLILVFIFNVHTTKHTYRTKELKTGRMFNTYLKFMKSLKQRTKKMTILKHEKLKLCWRVRENARTTKLYWNCKASIIGRSHLVVNCSIYWSLEDMEEKY